MNPKPIEPNSNCNVGEVTCGTQCWNWFDMDDAVWLLTHELDAEIVSAWEAYFTTAT